MVFIVVVIGSVCMDGRCVANVYRYRYVTVDVCRLGVSILMLSFALAFAIFVVIAFATLVGGHS